MSRHPACRAVCGRGRCTAAGATGAQHDRPPQERMGGHPGQSQDVALRAIIEALADGALTPDQGSALAGAVASLVRTLDLVEFEQRLTALEVANVARQS
jgi:hypothetical protein